MKTFILSFLILSIIFFIGSSIVEKKIVLNIFGTIETKQTEAKCLAPSYKIVNINSTFFLLLIISGAITLSTKKRL